VQKDFGCILVLHTIMDAPLLMPDWSNNKGKTTRNSAFAHHWLKDSLKGCGNHIPHFLLLDLLSVVSGPASSLHVGPYAKFLARLLYVITLLKEESPLRGPQATVLKIFRGFGGNVARVEVREGPRWPEGEGSGALCPQVCIGKPQPPRVGAPDHHRPEHVQRQIH
jgi:hypothetical protein